MGANLAKEFDKAREKGIKELDLGSKDISKLPTNIGTVKTLTKLNLSNNSLSYVMTSSSSLLLCPNNATINVYNQALCLRPLEICPICNIWMFSIVGWENYRKRSQTWITYNILMPVSINWALCPEVMRHHLILVYIFNWFGKGFGAFNRLLVLDLSYNDLTELTPQIGLIVSLKGESLNKMSADKLLWKNCKGF